MRGNSHVRFGPGGAGKGPAHSRHLASVLPVLRVLTRRAYGFRSPEALITMAMLTRSGLCPPLPARSSKD
jgi:hypothetical protein